MNQEIQIFIMHKLSLATVLLFFILLTHCADTSRNNSGMKKEAAEQAPVSASLSGQIVQPANGDVFVTGDEIDIVLSFDENAGEISSVRMLVNGNEGMFTWEAPDLVRWNTSGQPVGSRQIDLMVTFDDQKTETYHLRLILKSDVVPRQYTYRVVNSYHHDIRAFTQGLVYDDGFIYESTGQYGSSTLRKVDLETGEVLQSHSLARDLFGEGLSIHDGKLYQLTWKSQVGFVYDKENFRLLDKVYYENEGWGLTGDGENFYKSDGSHYIYILDPHYFSESGRLEVYDNKGRVESLNELEFIDSLIYANVYGTNEIVMVEHETGKVAGIIDLTGLLDRDLRHRGIDVLNGIAYDHLNDRLFVTGKNWPRLFEIELIAR